MSATDFPNAFHRKKLQSDFLCNAVHQACVEPWGGEHDFTAIVMRAYASCGRDVIATVYRLRVVIATPRIEVGDFRCNAGLIGNLRCQAPTFIEVPGFHNLRHRLLLDNSQRGPHIRADLGHSNFFMGLVFSFRSLSCREEL